MLILHPQCLTKLYAKYELRTVNTLYFTSSVQLSCCTQMYFQLTLQYIALTPLQDSAAKLSHLHGATVHEDTCSILYNLSAVSCEYMWCHSTVGNSY